MDLHHLRTFREVARERSFTAAAKNLYVTQPAVSQQVKALETELGERLLDRRGRDVGLTPAGALLLEATERVFATVDDAVRRIRESRASDEGTVVLACGDTVALYLLPPALTEFRARFPKAEVTVRNRGSAEIVDLVLEGGADLGVVTGPARLDPALEVAPLLDEPMCLALPPGHPLAQRKPADLRALDGQAAVLLAKPSATRALVDRALRAAGVRLVPAMESGNLEVVKAYVARGFGLSILPAMAVRGGADGLVVHPMPAGFPRRRLVVLRRRDRHRTRLARELTECLARSLRPRARAATPRPA